MEIRHQVYCLYHSTADHMMCEYFLNFINILLAPLFSLSIFELFLFFLVKMIANFLASQYNYITFTIIYKQECSTMRIQVTSDSTCDLLPEYLETHHVEILPLYIIMNGKTYRDGVDISPSEIFAHVSAGGDLCTTAASNVDDYGNMFSRLLQQSDAIIHISISAEFSSCYQNAHTAALDFPDRVFVVDSRNLSSGHGHIVCEAVKMAEAGVLPPSEIAKELQALTNRVEASFLLDRLDYIRKGGRCSAIVALGANLLNLKPCINVVDGKMKVGKKYRGKYEKCILEYVRDRLQNRDDIVYERIFITHTSVENGLVDKIREAIQTYAPFTEIIETEAGCTISCHCGPNTLGILFIRSK